MSEGVVLKLGGSDFGGWKSVTVERSIQQGTGTFRLSVTERYPDQITAWRIKPDAECRLLMDGHQAIHGFVDSVDRAFDKSSRSVEVRGRDKTADVVDCCASPTEFKGLRLDAIASRLLQPYGIGVVVAPGTVLGAAFPRWAVEPGETIWECIERAARQRALLVITNGDGDLVITGPGTSRFPTALVEGVNILSATFNVDHSQRFHTYKALAQSNDERWDKAESAAHLDDHIIDKSVRKPRTVVFSAEDIADGVTIKQRAIWERNVRRGRGMNVSVTVQGLSDPVGGLWMPNQMIPVWIPSFEVRQDLLIVSTTSTDDENGKITELQLSPRSAWELLPEKPDEDTTVTPWGDSE